MFAVLLKIHCLPSVIWNWIVLFKRPKWQWSHSKDTDLWKISPWGLTLKHVRNSWDVHQTFKVWWFLKPKWPLRKGHPRKPRGGQVGSDKQGGESFFKNGRESPWESPWDGTLNRPVPRLIRMLVYFLCPIGGQHLSRCFRSLLIWRGLTATRRLAEPVWVVQESVLREEFQWKRAPKVKEIP